MLFNYLLLYVCLFKFLAVLDLRCCVLSGGHPVVEMQGRLTVVASLVEQYRLQGAQAVVVMACGLRSWGSRLPELGLGSCSTWA